MADKKYEKPESIDALTAEQVTEFRAAIAAELAEINAVEGTLSTEQIERAEALMTDDDALEVRGNSIAEAAAEAERRQADVRERIAAKNAAPAEPTDPDEGAGDEPTTPEDAPTEPVVEEPAPAEPAAAVEPEPVLASGTRRPTIAAVASQAPAVHTSKKGDAPVAATNTITAAANVPAFESGAELDGLGGLAEAFLSRTESFGQNPANMPTGQMSLSAAATKHHVAKITRKNPKHSVDRDMSLEEQFSAIMAAGDEKQFEKNSVIAAGGWCSPSETMYDLFSYHTSEGTLDIAEVTAKRGGIQFTKGPDFMSVWGDPDSGFIQTEAQAEAGDVKPCYALDCPPFEEVRLDAIGFCATAPLLTNAAYPELVRQVLDMLGAAHARRKSQYTINKIIASIGASGQRVFVPVGSAGGNSGIADFLGGLELQAMLIRQSLAMSTTATIEGFAPYWARAAFRHELSRRLGLTDPFRITDADVDGWLALRGIRLQYVYDYQMLVDPGNGGNLAYPTTLKVALYPAGAYTRLTNDVISLSAVYDHDLLTQNTFTAAFMEEGIAVANTRGYGREVTFSLNYEGASGFPQIGAGAGITFPTPTP